jgi:hypothetical protein
MELGTINAAEASTGSRTMADLVSLAGVKHADRPALKHKVGDEWVDVNYKELAEKVKRVALGLVDLRVLRHPRRGRHLRLDLPDELARGVPLRAPPLRVTRGIRGGRGAAREGSPRGG